MIIKESFGDHLRSKRNLHKLSQFDLAFDANINITYLSDIENNKSNPTIKVIAKLCNAMHEDVSEFLKNVDMSDYL